MSVIIERFGAGEPETLIAFGDKHGFALKVTERPNYLNQNGRAPSGVPFSRFYASFESVEVMDGGMLSGVYGNGNTIHDALVDYAPKLAGQRIVVHAMGPNREEFDVPTAFHYDQAELKP